MAHINKLPYYILYSILDMANRRYNIDDCYILDNWKNTLPLLWVCQGWSKILLQSVCYCGIVCCRAVTSNYQSDNNNLPALGGLEVEHVWTTNIELIRQRKMLHNISKIYIFTDGKQTSLYLYKGLNNIFDFTNIDWSNVYFLMLYDNYNVEFEDNKKNIINNLEDEGTGALFATSFIISMPNITALSISGVSCGSQFELLAKSLQNAYAKQLCLLFNSNCIIDNVVPRFTRSLTYLKLSLKQTMLPFLPYIYPHSLITLFLKDIPTPYIWQYFTTGVGDRTIIFDNLNHLTLIFDLNNISELNIAQQKSVPAAQYYKIIFPKLRNLSLHSDFIDNDIFFASFNPACFRVVDMNGSLNFIQQVERLGLHALKHISINIKDVDKLSEDSFYHTTNQIFKSCCEMEAVTLTIYSCAFDININRVKWNCLTRLCITMPVSYANIFELISSLPQLQQLGIGNFVLSNFEMGFSNRDIAELKVEDALPLNTNIRTLYIASDLKIHPADIVAAKICYLVIRMRSLVELPLNFGLHVFLQGFINHCEGSFPHLNNITLSPPGFRWKCGGWSYSITTPLDN